MAVLIKVKSKAETFFFPLVFLLVRMPAGVASAESIFLQFHKAGKGKSIETRHDTGLSVRFRCFARIGHGRIGHAVPPNFDT